MKVLYCIARGWNMLTSDIFLSGILWCLLHMVFAHRKGLEYEIDYSNIIMY